MSRCLIPVLFLTLLCSSAAGQTTATSRKNTVIVLGMIHGKHRTSARFGVETIKQLIRNVDPDLILCEIPPDRLDEANRQFIQNGEIVEPRVKVFPEYVDAMYPLSREMDFVIVPCAGWTKPMADARRKKLGDLKNEQPENYREMVEAQSKAQAMIKKEGGDDNPAFIHTDRYDEIVKQGMVPYNRHFNEVLGPGGWDNINRSHYALIEANLNKQKNRGKVVLIMFGAWHKYWFKEKLRTRDDIEIVNVNEYLKQIRN